MQVYLKCHIENCTQAHEYIFEQDKIVALEGYWAEAVQKDEYIEAPPKTGKNYIVSLKRPLRIDTSQDFWMLYQNALSYFNGVETETDLQEIKIVQCKIFDILAQTESILSLEVGAVSVFNIKELSALKYQTTTAQQIISQFINSNHLQIMNFEHFAVVHINIQSDLGWTFIVEKKLQQAKVILGNTWDFHHNYWEVCNEILSTKEIKDLGLQID